MEQVNRTRRIPDDLLHANFTARYVRAGQHDILGVS